QSSDIIAFKDPSGRKNVIITHRVINETEDGFKTKGDASEDPDQFTVKPEDVVGKPVVLVPFVGYLFGPKGSKNPLIWLFLVILPAGLIIAGEITNIFTSPLKARKKEKEKRRAERKKRTRIEYKKFFLLFLILSIPFFIISAPYLAMSGNVDVDTKIKNSGLVPSVIVFSDEKIVPYAVLPTGNATGIEISAEIETENTPISSAPYLMPVFWIVCLSQMNLFLPPLLTSLIPPLIISLIFYPVWLKDIRRKRGRKKKKKKVLRLR
ncbi:MAG: hypothetical protein QMD22_08005, partial [archaeon]|nr:hypothetical protein [archaeon]